MKVKLNNKIKPVIVNSGEKIEIDWEEINIVQVEYPKYCGMLIVSFIDKKDLKKRFSSYISKRGKDCHSFIGDTLNITPNLGNPSYGFHSIVLAGGSSLGLECFAGVQEVLLKSNIYWYNNILSEKEREEFSLKSLIERVTGAICYTKNIIDKEYVYPDVKMGRFGMKHILKSVFNKNETLQKIYLGQKGVGLNSVCSKLNSPGQYYDNSFYENLVLAGVGGSFYHKDGLKILTLININSMGVVHDNFKLLHEYPNGANNIGEDIRGDKLREHFNKIKNDFIDGKNKDLKKPSNTTLSIIITNVKLTEKEKEEIGEEFHDEVESMIFPYGTIYDGDILYLMSTWDIDFDKKILLETGKKEIRTAIKGIFKKKKEMKGGGDLDYEKYKKYKNKYLDLKSKNKI